MSAESPPVPRTVATARGVACCRISGQVLHRVARVVQNAKDGHGLVYVSVEHAVGRPSHPGATQTGEPVDRGRAMGEGPDAIEDGIDGEREVVAQCGVDRGVVVACSAQVIDRVLAEHDPYVVGHNSSRTSVHSRTASGCSSTASRASMRRRRSSSVGM